MSIDIFAITIARVDGETQVPARATIRVEVAAGEIRVTDVNIRADESGSVDKASLPVIELLLRALTGQQSPIQLGHEASPRPEVTAELAGSPKPH
jgi:hypothetical protein